MSDAHPANGADTTRKAACKEVVNSGVEVEAQPLIHVGVGLGPALAILNLEEEMDVAAKELFHLRARLGAEILDHSDQDLLLPLGLYIDSLLYAHCAVGLLLVCLCLHVRAVWHLFVRTKKDSLSCEFRHDVAHRHVRYLVDWVQPLPLREAVSQEIAHGFHAFASRCTHGKYLVDHTEPFRIGAGATAQLLRERQEQGLAVVAQLVDLVENKVVALIPLLQPRHDELLV
mmetsp:Transcript_73373/g.107735  ORF Transcript_73373/g.107735 Transcript_73373/m.107735 type:complete len:230 (-) Transcript_73373:76-765(-)